MRNTDPLTRFFDEAGALLAEYRNTTNKTYQAGAVDDLCLGNIIEP